MTPKDSRKRPELFLHDDCLPQELKDEEADKSHERREALVRRACAVMGWDYHTSPAFGAIRKVAMADAVAVGLDKLAAMLDEIERLRSVFVAAQVFADSFAKFPNAALPGSPARQLFDAVKAATKQ